MKLLNIFKKDVHDCLICVLRPAIRLGFSSSFIATPECPHVETTVKKPKLKQCKLITIASILFNSLVFLGLAMSIYHLAVNDLDFEDSFKYGVLVLKFVNALFFIITFYMNREENIKFANGIIEIIHKRKLFGIETILTRKILLYLRIFCLLLVLGSCFSVSVLFIDSIRRDFTFYNIVLSFTFAVRTMNHANYTILGSTHIVLYWLCLDVYYKHVKKVLTDANNRQPANIFSTSLLQKIRHLQTFYIVICRNYKNHFRNFGSLLFYAQQFTYGILTIVQSYFYYIYINETGTFNLLAANYCEADNYYTWFGFPLFIWLVTAVTNSGEDLIDFIYRYKINSLSTEEASQVEMLLITMDLEKPNLTAADLFSLGIHLLASVSGTAITYVLVALQYQESFKKKIMNAKPL